MPLNGRGDGCDAEDAASVGVEGGQSSHLWGSGVTRSDRVFGPRQKGWVPGDEGQAGTWILVGT